MRFRAACGAVGWMLWGGSLGLAALGCGGGRTGLASLASNSTSGGGVGSGGIDGEDGFDGGAGRNGGGGDGGGQSPIGADAGDAQDELRPTDAPGVEDGPGDGDVGLTVLEWALGEDFTCARLSDRTVKCWGYGEYGQLGDGTTTIGRALPAAVAGLADVVELKAGQTHACARLGNGDVKCWGFNEAGQLGDGTRTDRLTPFTVVGLSEARGIGLGNQHSCAILADGSAACWGRNDSGQLGTGDTGIRVTPYDPVYRLTNVNSLALALDSSCALHTSGTVICWGSNGIGLLGDGTSQDRLIPDTGSILSDVTMIEASSSRACAVFSNRSVACWGNTVYDPLLDGGTGTSRRPVMLEGLSAVTAIGLGGETSCAILLDAVGIGRQTLECWGNNLYGQLGRGEGFASSSPLPVQGLGPVAAFGLGSNHVCASLEDGTAKCWGKNDSGQLGAGRMTPYQATPVEVQGLF